MCNVGYLEKRCNELEPNERADSIHLESTLERSCSSLIRDVEKLSQELRRVESPAETRGDLLLNHIHRLLSLPSLQQAHATVKARFKDFEQQQSCLDRHNQLIMLRRTSQLGTPCSSRTSELDSASVSSHSSTSWRVTSSVIDSNARMLAAKSLLDAVHADKYNNVERLLKKPSVDPNVPFPLEGGSSAIVVASSNGNKPMVELLLRHNADTSSRGPEGQTALHIASISNRVDIIELLILHKANPATVDHFGHTPLWYATCGKETNNSFEALLSAATVDIDGLLDNKFPSPLWAAAAVGREDRASALLEQGADFNRQDKKGRTLLHRVNWPIAAPLTKLLLQHGASPWARDFPDKRLPLHRAAEQGRIDIAAMLLDKMVEQQECSKTDASNVRDSHGVTPLMCAALQGSLPLVLYLVREWDAVFNLQDDVGNDAFYCACAEGHILVANFLLGLGADINRGNNEGHTPLHVATTQGQEAMIEFLLSLGADA
ncbi:hypothetical protein CDV36_016366 [Fusarium kuroshium]|uniref:Uncharacterized protein n=2 Tax=Fusarium solani species complex TaxID=232080 RepID=A0A3M2QSP6_9HYPO|nr:hypothetical protein CDV36_016366 [Fusarium kuroshium]